MIKKIACFATLLIFLQSCGEQTVTAPGDSFDRTKMMEVWVDDFIVPGYTAYQQKTSNLSLAFNEFQLNASSENLSHLRIAYLDAYRAWQRVSLFEIGEAEKLGLRGFTNTFPADVDKILDNVQSGLSNLELPSNRTAQGFPALDFILFEKIDEEALLVKLSADECSTYTGAVVERLNMLSGQVLNSWNAEKRASFINSRESTDRMVNDFLFYYEKYLRAGKVGIPAGVFSGNPLPGNAEAPYSGIYAREFLEISLKSVQEFFNAENGLADYLAFMDKADIATDINGHWNSAMEKIAGLQPNIMEQVSSDNIALLEVYDELQKAVVLLKVDMLQALSIQVDYVDADGD